MKTKTSWMLALCVAALVAFVGCVKDKPPTPDKATNTAKGATSPVKGATNPATATNEAVK